MSDYVAHVELADRHPDRVQLDVLVDRLREHAGIAAVADVVGTSGAAVRLSLSATSPEQASNHAARAVRTATRHTGLTHPVLTTLEVRLAENREDAAEPFAAHVELAERQPTDEQLDWMATALRPHAGAIGVNDYGYLTCQIEVSAADMVRAGERALFLVRDAARLAEIGDRRVVQMEVLDTVEELQRRVHLPPRAMIPALLSKTQAAEVLGLSRQQLNRLANDGRLGAIRVGSDWVFPEFLVQQEKTYREAGR